MAPKSGKAGARSRTMASPSLSSNTPGVEKHQTHHTSRPIRKRKTHPKLLRPVDPGDELEARKQSRLLSLPSELRLLIWEYALTSQDATLYYNAAAHYFDTSTIASGLITTCHSVALETLYLPLRLNTLVFDRKQNKSNIWNCVDFMCRIGNVERKMGCDFKFKGVKLSPDKDN